MADGRWPAAHWTGRHHWKLHAHVESIHCACAAFSWPERFVWLVCVSHTVCHIVLHLADLLSVLELASGVLKGPADDSAASAASLATAAAVEAASLAAACTKFASISRSWSLYLDKHGAGELLCLGQ